MKHILFSILIIPALFLLFYQTENKPPQEEVIDHPADQFTTITGFVESKETLESIFSKHNLDKSEMNKIYHASKEAYDLSMISIGKAYSFKVDIEDNAIQSMQFGIDSTSFLNIEKGHDGFIAKKIHLPVNRKTGSLYLEIQGSLALSMPNDHREYHKLALQLSEIFAWDIDFHSDIRNGDSVKILVEELWIGGAFKGYGRILAAEFVNDGKTFSAYRFEQDSHADYYDDEGRSLKKALLRSPLQFKYISSRFSKRRLHPKLRVYRPHLGVDYAASAGTPVSAAGNGKVVYAGYKGQMGKMVRIKHSGGYQTYYGHLSKIPRNIRKGAKVSQGDTIGYVGATGLATGPHLDYRIRINGKFVNPLKLNLPKGTSVQKEFMARFQKDVRDFNVKLMSIDQPFMALNAGSKSGHI